MWLCQKQINKLESLSFCIECNKHKIFDAFNEWHSKWILKCWRRKKYSKEINRTRRFRFEVANWFEFSCKIQFLHAVSNHMWWHCYWFSFQSAKILRLKSTKLHESKDIELNWAIAFINEIIASTYSRVVVRFALRMFGVCLQ